MKTDLYWSGPADIKVSDTAFDCQGDSCHAAVEPEESSRCSQRGCSKVDLCDGCTYQCSTCDNLFCRGHVVALPIEGAFAALYRCAACLVALAEVA